MKNAYVLFVIIILQAIIFTTNACENQVLNLNQSSITKQKVKFNLRVNNESVASNNKNQSTKEAHEKCSDCKFCFHLLVCFKSESIKFLANDLYNDTISNKFIYQPPFLHFLKKPPIKV